MRRELIAAVVLLAGCASASPPPGGPEDRLPPRLVRVTPDTNAINVRNRAAVFHFDEVINDRGTGAQDVSNFFLVSPSDGEARVSWHRQRIEVRPRRGFRANTAYTVTLLPGLADLRSNVMKEGRTLIFATGPTIPTLFIRGVAFDWVAERPAARALIQAVTADSVTYLAQADSVGRFTVGPLDPGSYLVRAIIDQNSNRGLDRSESWDSLRVVAPQASPAELLAAPRDTLPARIMTASISDSVSIRLTFDRLLDPAQTFAVASFRVAGADSVAVPITAVLTPRDEVARTRARELATLDSARRADSVAGRARPPAPAAPAPGRTPVEPPKPSRPAPFTSIQLLLGRALPPSTNYRVTVTTVRALSGRALGSERTFTTPRPAPPPTDSTRAAPAPTAAPGAPPAGARP